MKKKSSSLITGLLVIICIFLFLFVIYFCIDIFNIVDIPKEYSIFHYITSEDKLLAFSSSVNDFVDEKFANKKQVIVVDAEKNETYIKNKESNFESANEENISNIEIKNENVEAKFYYNQLDIYAKTIYDELYRHIDDIETGRYTADFDKVFDDLLHEENGANILENDFQLAVNALVFDKPEIFYLDITKIYLFTEITSFGSKKTYRVSIGPNENESYLAESFRSKEDVAKSKLEIQNVANKIQKNNDTYKSIKNAHDYIISNIEYEKDTTENDIYNIYGTLVKNKAVCEGYAKSFKFLMDEMNIPCIIVCGTATRDENKSESHAWNYVKINDVWYAVDPTWDDPIIIGNGSPTREMKYRYFLRGSNYLFGDHQEDGILVGDYNFKYPVISINDYN